MPTAFCVVEIVSGRWDGVCFPVSHWAMHYYVDSRALDYIAGYFEEDAQLPGNCELHFRPVDSSGNKVSQVI